MTGFNCRDPKVIAGVIREKIWGTKNRVTVKSIEDLVPLAEELLLMTNDVAYSEMIREREHERITK